MYAHCTVNQVFVKLTIHVQLSVHVGEHDFFLLLPLPAFIAVFQKFIVFQNELHLHFQAEKGGGRKMTGNRVLVSWVAHKARRVCDACGAEKMRGRSDMYNCKSVAAAMRTNKSPLNQTKGIIQRKVRRVQLYKTVHSLILFRKSIHAH